MTRGNLAGSERGLIVLNVALLSAVVLLAWSRPAGAQNSGPTPATSTRARGDYTMVAGKTMTGGADAVYVLDVANQELVALRWDGGKQTLIGLGFRDLAADAKVLPGR